MTLWCRIGLLLFLAMQPRVVPAADMPAGPLIARGDQSFPPYEFINESGQPDGFNIDLLKAISRRLEMNVDIGLDAWETVREDLAKGDIHLVTGMVRSAEREKRFDFSITHAGVFYCLFVRKESPIRNIDDARGKEILVHALAYSQDWLTQRHITDQVIPVSSPQEALQMLADGRHDCAVIERLSAIELLDYFKIGNVVMAGPPLMCAPYAFAVQKGDDRLLAKLNEGIHLMHQSGVYEDLYRKWFSVADAHTRRLAMLRAGALVLAAVLGVAVAVFVWNIALKRMVRRRTTALRQSDRQFQELCDLLPQTVFETDAKGRITFLNQSGFDMLGVDEASIPNGILLSDFLPGEPDLDEWAQSGDRCGKACVISGPDIDAFPALLYATPVLFNGSHAGLRGLLVDITFQKELEKQVIESQKLEALGWLAGGVAHDFNNIITGISAYAQLIRKQPHNQNMVADHSERILTGCDRATDLVRHFLATAGRRQPEKQLVRLQQVVSEVFKLLQPTYGLNITFNNTVGSENNTVWAEPALVFQVLMNLCVNGAQAMSDKGGTITVGLMGDAAKDRESSTASPQRVIFITDTGPGIEPELRQRIFEPFFTTRDKDNGTGIGLFVVCQALSDMDGSVRVASEPGKGATFIVSLPAAPSPAQGIVPDAAG
jgi:signal transduction histidine kinase/ABC-type amino acid transport substrate-binding protein